MWNAKCILDNASIYCQLLSYLIDWEWKEYARGVSPRSAPLDLSAEAGKCSPGEVTGLSHAEFVWQKAYWHFQDVKEQFVYGSKHNSPWQLFCPRPQRQERVCKGAGQVPFLGFRTIGFHWAAAAVLGFHTEGKWWTPNSLAWTSESSLWACAEILFPVRCRFTPLSDGVFSWKTVVDADRSNRSRDA